MDIAPTPNRFAEELTDDELRVILREARDEAMARAQRAKDLFDQQVVQECIAAQALVDQLFA